MDGTFPNLRRRLRTRLLLSLDADDLLIHELRSPHSAVPSLAELQHQIEAFSGFKAD